MVNVSSISDVYPAIQEIIAQPEGTEHATLARVLQHRMIDVAWTSGNELLAELRGLLTNALADQRGHPLPLAVQKQFQVIVNAIQDHLK